MSDPKHTNRLVNETSPYLLQHAHNPVDWYPWCPEALKRALVEDKPILLSIGYSACHWCHVMERESFESEEIAGLMNKYFVNIKVDREERPDLDNIYQTAVQLFGHSGGWPLTVFLTPDLEPFYGGTYFPRESRPGIPGFPSVLLSIAKHYREHKENVVENVQKVCEALAQLNTTVKVREEEVTPETFERAVKTLVGSFDSVHGGFGTQPKFPSTMSLSLLMRASLSLGTPQYAEMAVFALRKMAEGGIYDQLGGGYSRYAVDENWLVPHFEKMLYDNALLTRANLEAFQITKDPLLERVVRETLEFILREMTHPDGGFYGALDADSDGEEGRFYVWTPQEIAGVLGEKEGRVLCIHYGVTDKGNVEGGRSVLSVVAPPEKAAAELRLPEADVRGIIENGRRRLFEAREQRVRPSLDEKIITSWNGLAISAFAEAARVLDEPKYERPARKAAEFVLKRLAQGSLLLRCWTNGKARLKGYLDDYAFFGAALLDLFELTQDARYLEQAIAFADRAIQLFSDDRHGGFFFTPRDHEKLVQRPKTGHDHSLPSGVSVMVMNLFRLFSFVERSDFREPAINVLRVYRKAMEENPLNFASLLSALDTHLSGIRQVIVVGDVADPATKELVRRIHQTYQPNKLLFVMHPTQKVSGNAPDVLRGKTQVDGKPTVYVCRNFVCSVPATEWEAIEPLLTQQIA
jgi:uncharacterized protein YyaL (SSP411 family)